MTALPTVLPGFGEVPRPVATGLDLSLAYTGIATVWSDGSIVVGSARSSGHRDDSLAVKASRFEALADKVVGWVPDDVEHVVVESPAYGMPQGAVDLGGLRWLVLTRLNAAGHLVSEVNPMHVKRYATDQTKSDKDQVVAAVVRRYPQADVTNNNTADAVVLAAMGARRQGRPVDEITVQRQVAYDKVRWSA